MQGTNGYTKGGKKVHSTIVVQETVLTSYNYRHIQLQASTRWEVEHGLTYKPGGVMVQDSDGNTITMAVEYVDDNKLILTSTAAFAGIAYFS